MELISYAQTDIGRRRKVNQDAFLNDDENKLYVVADGMGGHKGGEVASKLCVEVLGDYRKENSDLKARDLLDQGINKACELIHEKAKENDELAGMGTTVISLAFEKEEVFIGHVGDSRAYLLSKSSIWQVTEDHSLMNEELRAGRLHEGQLQNYQFKNVITRSVGYESHVAVDIYRRKVLVDDMFLLCTDGLSGLVEMGEMANEIYQNGPKQGLSNLVHLANLRGGDDNITGVVCVVKSV